MRKFAKISLAILLFSLLYNCLTFPVKAAGNAIFVLTSPRTTYYVGETVYVDIEVKTNGERINVDRIVADFTGGDVLTVNDFDIGDALPYKSPGYELTNDTDHINIGTFILVDYVDTDYLMGTLIFTANKVGSSDIAKPFLTGSHLIDFDQQEKINMAGCQGITINVIEPVTVNNPPLAMGFALTAKVGDIVNNQVMAFDPDGDNVTISWPSQYNANFSNPISGLNASANFHFEATIIGVYNFSYLATDDDPLNPLSATGHIQITVVSNDVFLPQPPPNLPPIFQPVANINVEVGQQVSFQALATDPDGNNVNLTWNIPAGAIFINVNNDLPTVSGDFSWVPTEAGSYIVNFYGVDDHPTDPQSAVLTVIINVSIPIPPENHAPVFQPVSNKAINLGQTVNFPVSATDPDGDMVTLTWTLPAGAAFTDVTSNVTATGNFSWTPTAEGVYTLIFNATDDNPDNPLSSTLIVSVAVSVPPPPPNNPPIFDPIPEKTLMAGETLNFTVRAYDPDGDNVTLTMDPLDTSSFSQDSTGSDVTGTFSWTPQFYGIYYVLFKATDDHAGNPLSSQLSVRITVFGGECPPCGGGQCDICTCEQQPQEFPPETVKYPMPVINSPSHPNQQIWYANNKAQFTWFTEKPGIGYVFNLDGNPGADPANAYFLANDTFFSFTGVADGFWYFHLKVQYADGWSETAHYQVKIDTTPPEFFKPSVQEEPGPNGGTVEAIYFSALDRHSGVAYYQIKFGEGEWQFVQSPYILQEADRGKGIIYLKAVDQAGNSTQVGIDPENLKILEEIEEIDETEKLNEELQTPEKIIERIEEIVRTREVPVIQIVTKEIPRVIYEKVLINPQVQTVNERIVTPSLLALAALNALSWLWPFLTTSLSYFPWLFLEPLLAFFRRKRKKWGVVYDSLTKVPVDFAIVRLYKKEYATNGDSKLIKTRISDKEGRYYLNVENPGDYFLKVEKNGYVFPTRFLKNFHEDNKYLDLYHGEIITVKEKDTIITANVPIDREDKKALPLRAYLGNYFRQTLKKIFAYSGLILAAVILAISPTWITFGAFMLHLIMFIFFHLIILAPKPRSWGIVYEAGTKKPLNRALVKIFDIKYSRLLEVQPTDSKGRYGFLVGANQYQLLVEKAGYEKQIIKPIRIEDKEKIITLNIGLKRLVANGGVNKKQNNSNGKSL